MIHDEGNPEDKHPPNVDGHANHSHVKRLFSSDTDRSNIMYILRNLITEVVC